MDEKLTTDQMRAALFARMVNLNNASIDHYISKTAGGAEERATYATGQSVLDAHNLVYWHIARDMKNPPAVPDRYASGALLLGPEFVGEQIIRYAMFYPKEAK